MQVRVVLLRGINVGGKNIVPMKKLREALEDAGFSDVQTYIQSGNVVLKSDHETPEQTAEAVADIVETGFGFRPGVIGLDGGSLRAALDDCPYPPRREKAVHYYFMASAPEAPDLDALKALAAGDEDFTLKAPVFYLHAPGGIGRSKLAAAAEKKLGVPATARNGVTVAKLANMVDAAEA